MYGWYFDNSVFLEDPGVYLRPALNRDPAFIRTCASKPRRLLETRRLIEVLRCVSYLEEINIINCV